MAFCMQPFQFPLYLKGLCRDIHDCCISCGTLAANGIVAGAFTIFCFLASPYSQFYFVLICNYVYESVWVLTSGHDGAYTRGKVSHRCAGVVGPPPAPCW